MDTTERLFLENVILRAKEAEGLVSDHKAETYLAVLIVGLLGRAHPIISLSDNDATLGPSTKAKTLAEFLRDKKPSTDLDKTLVVAYFLEKFQNQEAVNADDLAQAYLSAREGHP